MRHTYFRLQLSHLEFLVYTVSCLNRTLVILRVNFHAVVGATPDAEDLASQVSTEAQDGTQKSNLVTDCLPSNKFFEEDFSLRGIDPRHLRFEEGSLRRHLTHLESANGDIRPSGIGIEKGIESGCRCGEVDIRRQKDGHVFDDDLRHGADAEKAEFF